jgi:hypothetical protein
MKLIEVLVVSAVVGGFNMLIIAPIVLVILFLLLLFVASKWKIDITTTTAIILTCISIVCSVAYWNNHVL